MKKLKEDIRELRNLAKHNKRHIMNNSLDISIEDIKYIAYIKGVGAKAVKLELYISYEDMLKSKDHPLEHMLMDKINRVYEDVHSTEIGQRRVFY